VFSEYSHVFAPTVVVFYVRTTNACVKDIKYVDIQFRVFRGYGNLRIHDPNEVFIHFCNIAHN